MHVVLASIWKFKRPHNSIVRTTFSISFCRYSILLVWEMLLESWYKIPQRVQTSRLWWIWNLCSECLWVYLSTFPLVQTLNFYHFMTINFTSLSIKVNCVHFNGQLDTSLNMVYWLGAGFLGKSCALLKIAPLANMTVNNWKEKNKTRNILDLHN